MHISAKILILLGLFVVVRSILRRWQVRRGARRILEQQIAIYSGKMEFAEVSPRDFPWLNEAFYEEASMKMAGAGFQCIGDFECLTNSKQFPNMRTFLRCFISGDGSIMAAAYHVKMLGMMGLLAMLGIIRRNIFAIEFETEFADETFLGTNNLAKLNVFTDYPGLTLHQYEPGTDFEELLAHHRGELRRIVQERNLEPLRLESKQDVLESQDRLHALKSEHSKRRGYVSRQEFEELAGKELKGAQLELVEEFETLRDRGNAKA
jgi:hypothetical protein